MKSMLLALWAYRGFVVSSIRNDFLFRFGRSKLGGLWMILNPLAQAAIYALILSNVVAARLPGADDKYAFALYLMAGLLAWNLFADIIGRCLNLFIENAGLLKKMNFPRVTLPVITAGSCLLNNVLLFVGMVVVFIALGHGPGWQALWLLPLTLVVMLFGLALGLVLGVVNVFVRDVGQVVPILLQIWFWFTPIVYPLSILPKEVKDLVTWNPMLHLVGAYQDCIVFGRVPDIDRIAVVSVVAVACLLLGLFVFRRASAEMVDEL